MPRRPLTAGLLLACLFATSPALASQTLTLTEGWRARWGDPEPLADGRPGWLAPEFAESLEPVPAGGKPADRAHHNLLWVAVPVPVANLDAPLLRLGLSNSGAVEVWATGERVYASGERQADGSARIAHIGAHFVSLPPRALGERLLVRIQVSDGPLDLRSVRLGEGRDELSTLVRQSLFPMGVSSLGILLGITAFGAWLRFRNQRSLLALAGFSIAVGTMVLSQLELLPMLFGQSRVFGHALAIAAFISPPSLCMFVLVGFARERPMWLKTLIGVVAAASVLSLLSLPFRTNALDAVMLWLPVGIGGLLLAVVQTVVEARRGNFEARALTGGLGALVVTGILETSVLLGVKNLSGMMPFGLLVLFGSMVVIVTCRFTDLLRRTEQHARLLQSREDEVRRLGQRLAGGADRLAVTVASLRQAATVQAEVLVKQTAAITETQATAAQIGQTSELTSSKATAVLEAAEQAERAGRSGGEALSQTLSGLEAVRAEVVDMSQRFTGVGARSREIDSVVATVKDIADQSHLLALNARIEAARAGEQGRGFAVVAGELGRLAAQSLEATTRIRLALRSIDEAIRSAVQLSEGGSERVEEIVSQTRASAERLREISGIATGTGESAREIATAVSQQNAGVGQMLEAIRILADGFSQARGAMKEADRAAADVQQVASELLTATASPEG